MPLPENLVLWVSSLHLVIVAAMQLHLMLGMRRIRRVAALDSCAEALPSLSIVVAARNDERESGVAFVDGTTVLADPADCCQ